MSNLYLKRFPAASNRRTLWQLCLYCTLLTVSGCEQAADRETISENSSTAPQYEVETGFPAESQQETALKAVDRAEGEQVSVLLELPGQEVKPGMSFPLTVKFKMAPLWEIRDLNAQPANIATQIKLELPDGFQQEADWQAPASGRSLASDSHPVYSGQVEFRQMIQVAPEVTPGEYDVTCQVQYQACDEFRCLSPVQKKLQVTVRVK